ncbi:MAG: efflux RND transporter periplasmic adaptor subunit [Alphaproteobacteria bacterium]
MFLRPFVVLAALAVAPSAWSQETDGALVVTVDEVVFAPVSETVRVVGRLVARQRGAVSTRMAGLVEAIAVAVGDRVVLGDVIARIDDQRHRLDRALAVAALAEAEAAVADAEAEAAVAAAVIETAKARRGAARVELDRIEKLRNSAAFSQARFDDLTQEVAIAESLIAEAVARRASAGSTIDRQRAAVERARAVLAIADDDIADAVIRAPYDGVVVVRHAEVGAYLDSGDAVVELVNDSALEIEADVPADRVAPLSPGLALAVEMAPHGTYQVKVRAVIADENPMTRTRPVRFALVDPPEGLAAGESVVLALPIGVPRDALTVAKDAILREDSGAWVYVVVDGHAERRAVELGGAVGDRFEVLAGLAAGERVVVRGNERLAPGQAVSF